jgi:hypothetical protein
VRGRGRTAALLAAVLAAATPARAQSPDSVWATPRGRYDAGYFHRLLLSSGHRDLWSTPVRVEVLDLGRFAGGLTFEGLGGGLQTRSVRFRGADGRNYAFRTIDKDASRTLEPALRESIAARVLQDQIGSILPLGALVVAPLVDAAGVLQADPRLVVMPDDARLGEHRAEFAGLLGFIEERPNEPEEGGPAFTPGAGRITGSEAFLDRLEESSRNRVDDEAYLRARLIDIFVGDWDRHPDQWRWASFERGDSIVWEPIPRDRDWALARMDGLFVKLVPLGYPHYVGFGQDYPSTFRLTWSARALDRRLLSGTSRETWDAVVADLQRRLTDRVIADAVHRLPQPYYEQIGAWLTASLIHRRDELPGVAGQFYRQLAGWVDIRATDERDLVEVVRTDSGRVRVEIASGARTTASSAEPWFRRVFDPRETRELRLYLHGGDDHAAVIGGGSPEIVVRLIGGGGDDALIDRTSGSNVRFYDDRGSNRFERAPGTSLSEAGWVQPMDSSSLTQQAPARDWGAYWLPAPVLGYDTDLGLMVGAGFVRYSYRFRHYPWASRLHATVAYGTSAGRVRAQLNYDFPLLSRTWRGLLNVRYSGADVDRFYGFGNETVEDRERAFYEAQRGEARFETHVGARLGRVQVSAGPGFTLIRPFQNEGTLIDSVAPYGFGDFDQVGATARITWDGRDRDRAASHGAYLGIAARVFPTALDVEETYGGVTGEAALFLTADSAPLRPTLALRAGGEKLWGRYPYFEAAYIGGRGTLRGFASRRFAGDAALFSNAELRLALIRHQLLVPGRIGVFGLADAGRVFLDGEESDSWHTAAGGGVWLSFHDPRSTFTASVARSSERTGVYVGFGFGF